jgi:hypothetical protein
MSSPFDDAKKIRILGDPLIEATPVHAQGGYWSVTGPRVLRGGRKDDTVRAYYGTVHRDGKISVYGGKGSAGYYYKTYVELAASRLKKEVWPSRPVEQSRDLAEHYKFSTKVHDYAKAQGYDPIRSQSVVPLGDGVFQIAVREAGTPTTIKLRVPRDVTRSPEMEAHLARLKKGDMKLGLRSGRIETRDYEYVVYRSTKVSGTGIRIAGTGFTKRSLEDAKRVAKEYPGSGVYSTSKGRFVGWINFNGRYVPFR